ncbi:MAG: hypothetical protein SF053_15865 [Bacteroidia bacterium]|nr:hypothetical protein [Bacteroidia bacterium]
MTVPLPRWLAHRLTLPAILTAGLLVRILYAGWRGSGLYTGDAVYYMAQADNLARGLPLNLYWPPGLPVLLAVFQQLTKNALPVPVLMISVWLVFVRELECWLQDKVSRSSLNLLHLVFALYPAYIHHATAPLSHLPVALCLVAALRHLDGAAPGWRAGVRAGGAGLLLAAAILIRPATVLLVPAGLVRLRRPLPVVCWLLAALGPVTAWNLHLREETGRWIFVNESNSYNFFLGNSPWTDAYATWDLGSHEFRDDPAYAGLYTFRDSVEALPAATRDAAWSAAAWSYIGADPGGFVLRTLSRFRTFWAFDTYTAGSLDPTASVLRISVLGLDASLYLLLLGLALAGLCIRPAPTGRLALIWVAAYMLPYLLVFSHPTYHLPVMALLALPAGQALDYRGSLPHPWIWIGWGGMLLIQAEWIAYMADRL